MEWNFTNDVAGLAGKVSEAAPRWLRLTRSGEVIRGYDSADGAQLELVAPEPWPGFRRCRKLGCSPLRPGTR